MLSFICASNDIEMFNECVLESLNRQRNQSFEVICVDTRKKKYSSAVEALHEGAEQAKGDYFVFLHQDIVLEDADFVDNLLKYIADNSFLIAGVAGAVPQKVKLRKNVYSNILHGEEQTLPGIPIKDGYAMPCKSLDECLFVISRETYLQRPMKEYISTWHLYAVEYCLWAEQQQPGSVLIFPLKLWHKSAGASFNQNYYEALDKIIDVYKKDYDVIYTTMGAWPTNRLLLKLRNLLRR